VNYRKEIALLVKHRNTYGPVMDRLSTLHGAWTGSSEPVAIDTDGDMLTVLELLDIGYLDPEAFIIKQSFGDYRAVFYRGGCPFAAKGESYLAERRGKRLRLIAVAAVAAAATIAFAVLLLN